MNTNDGEGINTTIEDKDTLHEVEVGEITATGENNSKKGEGGGIVNTSEDNTSGGENE